MRCVEDFILKWTLKWTDFNYENRSVDVTPEKETNQDNLKTPLIIKVKKTTVPVQPLLKL